MYTLVSQAVVVGLCVWFRDVVRYRRLHCRAEVDLDRINEYNSMLVGRKEGV